MSASAAGGAAIDADGRVLALADGEILAGLDVVNGDVQAADWSPDGRFLLVAGNDEQPRLWDTATWEQVTELDGVAPYGAGGAWSADSRYVAVPDAYDGRVIILDAGSGEQVGTLAVPGDAPIEAIDWSPELNRISVFVRGGLIVAWDNVEA